MLRHNLAAAIYRAGEQCTLRRAVRTFCSDLSPKCQEVLEHMLRTMFHATVQPYDVDEDEYDEPVPHFVHRDSATVCTQTVLMIWCNNVG